MSIVSGEKALQELRDRLSDADDVSGAKSLVTNSPGFGVQEQPNWLWDRGESPDPTTHSLRTPAAYDLARADPRLGELIHRTPHEVVYAPREPVTAELTEAYCRHSVDLTMKGGTTSGVVYPLAICEIARSFRLRNVGGASAGAIGASAAAAAEIGRRAEALRLPAARPGDAEQGHVRRGFVGLADTMAWLAEIESVGQKPEYRLAQLFRPTHDTLSLYRIAVAFMRKKWLGIGLLAGGVLDGRLRIALLVATAFGITALAVVSASPGTSAVVAALVGVAGLCGLAAVCVAAVLVVVAVRARRPNEPSIPDLAEPVWQPPAQEVRSTARAVGAAALALLLGVALLAVPPAFVRVETADFWLTLPIVFLALAIVVLVVHLIRVWVIVSHAKDGSFGLIAGSTPQSVVRRGLRGTWNRVAGMAEPTVDRALVPWLSDTLSELAGVEGVLKFGHLWCGSEWKGKMAPDDPAITNTFARVVNLELMTSEIVQGVPYRFPLDRRDQRDRTGKPTLYVRKSDLLEAFPPDVVDAMAVEPVVSAHVVPSGDKIDDLYPFPDPWQLPVIFAVRLSMALPALFQAVRAYRRVDHLPIRDDFGRVIVRDEETFMYPADVRKTTGQPTDSDEKVSLAKKVWVEPLWFSDGGITSNFPIHFFDSPLPLWPTLGVTLEKHPSGFRHQDVWLSSDWHSTKSPATPLGKGFIGFAAAIVNTARGWRDTTQLFMPGYRGRIASVRQSKGEGGANLFMERETIAALALRGLFAGARLRRRFASDAYWQRHQWLRMRVALENIDGLVREAKVAMHQPVYSTLVADEAPPPILAIDIGAAGGDAMLPERQHWYTAAHPARYWEAARALAKGLKNVDTRSADALGDRSPYPTPDLRQVPPL